MNDLMDIAYSDAGTECRGDVRFPEHIAHDTGKVMMIHGGGWTGFDRTWQDGLAEDFRRRGFCTFNIDYRLAPGAPWPMIGDDCLAAAEYFYRFPDGPEALRNSPLAVLGVSAGGHLAMMTGLRMPRKKITAIVSISGIADPTFDLPAHRERYEKLFAGTDFTRKAFPEYCLKAGSPPLLLTHNVDDPCVDIRSSLRFAVRSAERGMPISTYFYDRGHGDNDHAVWRPDVRPRVLFEDIACKVTEFISGSLQTP